MMEYEVRNEVALKPEQSRVLDLHSFVNILSVLTGELQLLDLGSGQPGSLEPLVRQAEDLVSALRERGLDRDWEESAGRFRADWKIGRESLETARSGWKDPEGALESVQNIESVLRVLDVRVAEYLARHQTPGQWLPHSLKILRDNFGNFFAAVERNSKGQYRIIFNIAAQEEKDYVVNLTLESLDGKTITMPPELQDVFRDLVANARKYTPPGGMITAGLFEGSGHVRIVVEDNGLGIPEDEIAKVTEFGYRATNVRHLPTKGGGFGLTKAWFLCGELGGRMWIRSAPGKGTRIALDIPRQADLGED